MSRSMDPRCGSQSELPSCPTPSWLPCRNLRRTASRSRTRSLSSRWLSPSTARMDATTKLRGYFEVPSVQHYLIVDPEGQTVTHHKRGVAAIETRVISEGALALDPPGLEIHLTDIFARA